MTILFDWFETPGTNAEEKRTLHARPCFNGTSNTKTIAKRIQARSSLTAGDIIAVLSELNDVIGEELQNGRQVHINGLGYFAPTLGVEGEVTEDMKLQIRNRKVRFKSVSFRPDKELRASIGTPKLKQTRWEAHSQAHTPEEIEQLLSAFFAEHLFLTRRELQFLLNIKKSAACDLIKTLSEEGKLLNKGTHHQPAYVPAPGYFGKPSEG
ncbi:MAG: HU family DNA-binding protein [Parabacteroides sp.]|nr:HU family DNA-binding protein [Parabacteroides sp.]MDD6079182.1 HU family DNA-binding protein [bacterium]MCI7007742.1 HU family DNA-binding protein [Parabacteroides sp.]MCI7782260.1 HU family DNA-binding protein [Parabacteroides sp.]MDD7062238.1 HU family DNA-binding protein [bacterium]